MDISNDLISAISIEHASPLSKAVVYGVRGGARAAILLRLLKELNSSVLVLTATEEECNTFYKDLKFFSSLDGCGGSTEERLFRLLPVETSSNEALKADYTELSNRMTVFEKLNAGENIVCVAALVAAMQKVLPAAYYDERVLEFKSGDDIHMEELAGRLLEMGYQHADVVRQVGDFSIRGGVMDIFPPVYSSPFRLELFGDSIDSIREFDSHSQMSTSVVVSVVVRPLGGVRNGGEMVSVFDYMNAQTCIVLESMSVVDAAGDMQERICRIYFKEDRKRYLEYYISCDGLQESIGGHPLLLFEAFRVENGFLAGFHEIRHSIMPLEVLNIAGVSLDEKLDSLELLRLDYQIMLVCKDEGELQRLSELLGERSVPVVSCPEVEGFASDAVRTAPVVILAGDLSTGFTSGKMLFATTSELFGKKVVTRRYHKQKKDLFLSSFDDLKINAYVVHVDYGIGRYVGLKKITSGNLTREFIQLEYDREDILYVPVERLDLVQKYISAEGGNSSRAKPVLSRLGGSAWERSRKKAKKAVEDIVDELLELYSSRKVFKGFSFLLDDHLQMEFDGMFEFEETPDQMSAIIDVKRDMESERPMDRLVCGDVGYGKTEVILRGVFKAVNSGKQVAVLVPTTLLAFQHFRTFSKRFSMFPAKVEMLSRFRTAREQKKILLDLKAGVIDVLIGTHRLIQKDCEFKNLGLVVIDEEQKFGVSHKERFKKIRKSVDVLTLTATPIPRTLQMSLAGISDISTIATPPADRLAIETHVIGFDREIIKEAIMRELIRGGKVFFVNNRVKNIVHIGNILKEILPELKIGIAHGQMGERELESVMMKFLDNEYQLLLSTSIIESGLDIPEANTIIINRADMFGLADLYQMRGRVGRSGQQAYAYLIVPEGGRMTAEAVERINAIMDSKGAGAGFQIAMKDLEIRGAGHLLGSSQSGHIAGVGFELFTKMIEEAVSAKRGVAEEVHIDPAVDLGLSAYISENYIPQVQVRLNLYKRLSAVSSEDELCSIKEEICDRFGKPPQEVVHLFNSVEIKLLAISLNISKIDRKSASRFLIGFNPLKKLSERVVSFFLTQKEIVGFVSEYTIEVRGYDETTAAEAGFIKAFLMSLKEVF